MLWFTTLLFIAVCNLYHIIAQIFRVTDKFQNWNMIMIMLMMMVIIMMVVLIIILMIVMITVVLIATFRVSKQPL